MKLTKIFMAACALAMLFCAQSGLAADKKLLVVNLTSSTNEESRKAVDYAKDELEQGRPVVIFLNQRGVLAAALTYAKAYRDQQRDLAELMKRGATVLVCPDCLQYYGVDPTKLLAGVKIARATP